MKICYTTQIDLNRMLSNVPKLTKEETHFQQVVEAMPNALIMTYSQGILRLANTQEETLVRHAHVELVGKEILVPKDRHRKHPSHERIPRENLRDTLWPRLRQMSWPRLREAEAAPKPEPEPAPKFVAAVTEPAPNTEDPEVEPAPDFVAEAAPDAVAKAA